MIISIVVAIAQNNVIGNNNKLLWHIPEDLKYFKSLTMGAPIIMGRKTFESIGRALPGRLNIIISRNDAFEAQNCIVVNSLDTAIAKANTYNEVFIIGGGEIYKQAIDIAHKLYITEVYEAFSGDTFFPYFDSVNWELINKSEILKAANGMSFSFLTYQKKIAMNIADDLA